MKHLKLVRFECTPKENVSVLLFEYKIHSFAIEPKDHEVIKQGIYHVQRHNSIIEILNSGRPSTFFNEQILLSDTLEELKTFPKGTPAFYRLVENFKDDQEASMFIEDRY